ncbi:MAG: hypothetical protein CL927_18695 [Deltaproteobacteria bacterium]|nr:hypothetical protein [Deltaproteobacteria bacterium]HCH62165.1 hypothetical protein [Deltaproteobacteria bacterium]
MNAPRQPMMYLQENAPITASPESYIDYSVTNSLLSGLLIAVLAAWAMVMFNRLWQSTLRSRAAPALAHAQTRGMTVHPDGTRARVVAEGSIGSEPIRIEWRGGVTGLHVILLLGDRILRLPFIEDPLAFEEALLSAQSTD